MIHDGRCEFLQVVHSNRDVHIVTKLVKQYVGTHTLKLKMTGAEKDDFWAFH